jgi:hypothetical protein
MQTTLRIIAAASFAWAAVLLAAQLLRAWGGGRKDYAVAAGSGARGVIYNLTAAMSPAHKEAARNHPVKFGAGVLLHAGVAVALLELLALVARPCAYPRALGAALAAVLALALASSVFLFCNRLFHAQMRALSSWDDYLSPALTFTLLALAAAYALGRVGAAALLVYGAAFFFYLPIGKLRHVLFCPVSRIELGRRLGLRGTFPPAR